LTADEMVNLVTEFAGRTESCDCDVELIIVCRIKKKQRTEMGLR
jgi:hypothetical protein